MYILKNKKQGEWYHQMNNFEQALEKEGDGGVVNCLSIAPGEVSPDEKGASLPTESMKFGI